MVDIMQQGKEMKGCSAGIITVGDELLNGDIINTNAAWLSGALRRAGFTCRFVYTAGDDKNQILDLLENAWGQCSLIIVTGGLGPTRDDVTRKVLLEFFRDKPVRNQEVLAHVTDFFQKRGRTVTDVNKRQADVPSQAQILFNELGTAPGMLIEKEGKVLVALPGVPYELEHITGKRLLPWLNEHRFCSGQILRQHYIRTTGVGESDLSDQTLRGLDRVIPASAGIAFLPHPGGVDIRITELFPDESGSYQAFIDWITGRNASCTYSRDYRQSLASALVALLLKNGKTLAVAESCTGGFISNQITNTPGSSGCFKGAVVAYDNQAKITQLDVSEVSLAENGAVSHQTALEMARGVARRFHSDFGISATGIAGPEGGTPDKPVGTVYIGFWAADGLVHFACRYCFSSLREINKERSTSASLEIVRRHLTEIRDLPYHPEVFYP